MLCELGFLVDMLEKASGQNCQASNFLKTMGSLPTAASLNLLEEQAGNTSLTMTMQNANRFLLDRFVSDMKRVPVSHSGQVSTTRAGLLSLTTQTMATKISSTIRCAHCNAEQMRPEEPLAHDLMYPSKVGGPCGVGRANNARCMCVMR
jgi:PAB-dependent poly(A)-specific ribonuclease subunit 2